MGKHKHATKGGPMLKRASPSLPLFHVGEAGYTCDVVHDLRDEVASLEESLSQMGASSKTPFLLCVVWQIVI